MFLISQGENNTAVSTAASARCGKPLPLIIAKASIIASTGPATRPTERYFTAQAAPSIRPMHQAELARRWSIHFLSQSSASMR